MVGHCRGRGNRRHLELTSFDRYEFDSAAAILLVIIGIVMLVEYTSGYTSATEGAVDGGLSGRFPEVEDLAAQ